MSPNRLYRPVRYCRPLLEPLEWRYAPALLGGALEVDEYTESITLAVMEPMPEDGTEFLWTTTEDWESTEAGDWIWEEIPPEEVYLGEDGANEMVGFFDVGYWGWDETYYEPGFEDPGIEYDWSMDGGEVWVTMWEEVPADGWIDPAADFLAQFAMADSPAGSMPSLAPGRARATSQELILAVSQTTLTLAVMEAQSSRMENGTPFVTAVSLPPLSTFVPTTLAVASVTETVALTAENQNQAVALLLAQTTEVQSASSSDLPQSPDEDREATRTATPSESLATEPQLPTMKLTGLQEPSEAKSEPEDSLVEETASDSTIDVSLT